MKRNRILRGLAVTIITSAFLATGCGERLGANNPSGGGTTNSGDATSENTEVVNTTETENNTEEDSVDITKETNIDVSAEHLEAEPVENNKTSVYIMMQGRNIYCDDELILEKVSVDKEDDVNKIGDFVKDVKEKQYSVQINYKEADSDVKDMVVNLLEENGIEYEIEVE